jgi:hypothetical protein
MAEVLDSFLFTGRGFAYSWDLWLDGRIWKLTKGVDFRCKVHTLQSMASARAKSVGGKCKSHIVDKDTLVIQFRANVQP